MFVYVQAKRLTERAANPLANGSYLSNGFVVIFAKVSRQYHHKLVAAQAGYGVAVAYAGDQARSHLLQQSVTQVVAERVIEQFKIIEVYEQQCAGVPVPGA